MHPHSTSFYPNYIPIKSTKIKVLTKIITIKYPYCIPIIPPKDTYLHGLVGHNS